MTLVLNSRETRLVLEALATLNEKWTAIIEAAANKGEEGTAADYGNDALQLNIVQERIEAAAVAELAWLSRTYHGRFKLDPRDQ